MPSLNIERCFTVIEILCEHGEGLPLGDIATLADMPKSATHRMLTALCGAGYVTQLPSRNYRLTLALAGLGFRFLSNTSLLDEAQLILDRLAAEVGELVRMSLVDRDRLVWVARAQGARSGLVVDPVTGHPVVPHATATGKVWLASLSTEQALRIVLAIGFGSPDEHGPNVIQSVEALQAELALTGQRGFGLAIEEADPGVSAIAVPVTASEIGDTVIGTISIAGPTSRVSEQKLVGFLPSLQHAARQLTGIDVLMQFANEGFGPAQESQRRIEGFGAVRPVGTRRSSAPRSIRPGSRP